MKIYGKNVQYRKNFASHKKLENLHGTIFNAKHGPSNQQICFEIIDNMLPENSMLMRFSKL